VIQVTAHEAIVKALFVDLGEPLDDWDFTAGEAFHEFMNQRQYLKLDGALETPDHRFSSISELNMVHAGPLIWDLLDNPIMKTLHLQSFEEFMELLNGCATDALMRNSFAMVRYLQIMAQELHEALQRAHETIGLANDERVARRSSTGPTVEAGDQSNTPLKKQLRLQLELAQQDLARARMLIASCRVADSYIDVPVQSNIIVCDNGATYHHHPLPMTPGDGKTGAMYALSHVHGHSSRKYRVHGQHDTFTDDPPGPWWNS
jgi:hypothetical protein